MNAFSTNAYIWKKELIFIETFDWRDIRVTKKHRLHESSCLVNVLIMALFLLQLC
jgi:hypothetical protein